MIGNIVTVKVDRPMGSYHPKHKDIYIIRLTMDTQKESLRLMEKNKMPIQEYTGIIIAIIHRYDDVEEKWVVAPKGMTFTKEEIREKTYFQEQYFDSEIRM